MIARQNYYFIRVCADNGEKFGLGHLVRTIEIIKEITKKNFNFDIIFLVNSNPIVKLYINSTLGNFHKYSIIEIKNYNLKIFFNIKINRNDVLFVDNLGKDSKLINIFIKKGLKKIISLDDLKNKLTSKSIIINSIYSLKKKILKKNYPKGIKIYQSLKYLPLKKEFNKKFSFKRKENLKNIIVLTGGADYNNLSLRLLSFLKKYKKIKIKLLTGKAYNNFKALLKLKKKYSNLRIIKHSKNIIEHLNKSNLIISTGGNVMFETLVCRKTAAIIQNYYHQKYAINFFNKKKCIFFIGTSKRINFKLIDDIINNFREKRLLLKKAPEELDGQGLNRIAKILKKI